MRQQVKLSELFRIGSSKRVLKSQWQTEGVPFYRGREVTKLAKDGSVDNELFITEELYSEFVEKYGVPTSGDIIVTAIGTIGNSYIVQSRDRFYFKDASVLWLKKITDVSSEYINLWLKSSLMREQLDEGNGATVDTLTIKKLQGLLVDLPSILEQQRIVGILDKAFASIATATAHADQNLRNARELFESTLNRIFTEKGEGWVENTLDDLSSKIGSGATPRGGEKSYKVEGIPLIRSLNVHDRRFKKKKLAFIDDEQAEKLSNVIVEHGDVLLNITGASVARCCIVPDEYVPARVNQHVSIIRINKGVVSAPFLNYLLTSKNYKDELLQTGNKGGATRQAITKKQIESFLISFPSLLEQDKVTEELDTLATKTKHLEAIYQQKLAALAELKQSLLQQAFAGEL